MSRVRVPLAIDFGRARASVAAGGSLVNFYPQTTPVGAKDDVALVGAPGAKARAQLRYESGPDVFTDEVNVNAAIFAFGKIIAIADNGTYAIEEPVGAADAAWEYLGPGLAGLVSAAFNGVHVLAVNGTDEITTDGATVGTIADVDFYPADGVTFKDGTFFLNRRGTGQVFASDPYSLAFNGLAFGNAEASPDDATGVHADFTDVLVFGGQTTQVFYNAGTAPFPLAPVPGAVMAHGLVSMASVASYDGRTFWLTPKGLVICAIGQRAVRISTEPVEEALAARVDEWPTARGYCYQEAGQSFYVLTVGELTLVYGENTESWCQRANYSRGHALVRTHVAAWGRNWGFDDRGRLLEVSTAFLDDAGEPLVGEIVTMPYAASRDFLAASAIEIEIDTGAAPLGAEHSVLMSFSDDGGRSWSSERPASLGRTGQYGRVVQWRKLGASRDRRFRFRMSDPFRRTLLSKAWLGVH